MDNFLSKIFTHKKALAIVFVFLIVAGIFVPYGVVRADFSLNPFNYLSPATQNKILGLFLTATDPLEAGAKKIQDILGKAASPFFNALIFALSILPLGISAGLSDLAGILLKTYVSLLTSGLSYTHNSAVNFGWPIVRDLANMVIVLGFVIIGIATAIRFKDYEAKKLLPKLIIAALLINFSLLICGIFIDGSNILVTGFLKTNSISDTFNHDSLTVVRNIFDSGMGDNPIAFLMKVVGAIFFNIVSIVVFFLFAFLFAFRIYALWILVILSPLAFVFYVFPATKKFFDMWWTNFFQWCVIVIPASFFLYIGTKMQSDLSAESTNLNFNSITDFSKSFTNLASFLVPAMFLIIGFMFSLQFSAMGAGMAVKAFKWSGKKAGALAKAGGKGLDSATGGTYGKVSSEVGHAMERIGLKKKGSTDLKRGEGLADSEKRMATLSDDVMKNDLSRSPTTATGMKDKAALIKRAVAEDKMHLLGSTPAEQARQIQWAESMGIGPGTRAAAEKLDPNLKAFNDPAVKAFMDRPDNRGKFTYEQAQQEVVADAASRMSRQKIRDMSSGIVSPAVISGWSKQQTSWALNESSEAVQNKVKAHSTKPPDTADRASIGAMADARNKNYLSNLEHIGSSGVIDAGIVHTEPDERSTADEL